MSSDKKPEPKAEKNDYEDKPLREVFRECGVDIGSTLLYLVYELVSRSTVVLTGEDLRTLILRAYTPDHNSWGPEAGESFEDFRKRVDSRIHIMRDLDTEVDKERN